MKRATVWPIAAVCSAAAAPSAAADRAYATGISNGAVFSHYLAAHLSARIAAIAPVMGGIRPAPGCGPSGRSRC